MTDISKEFMDRLYRQDKILAEDITWEHQGGARYSLDVRVHTMENEFVLTLKGKVWKKSYSFSLLYRNNIVRLWDFNDHHEGITGHKHSYTPNSQYGEPYPVDDISTSDVNQALIDFLDECSIRYEDATIHELTELDDYV